MNDKPCKAYFWRIQNFTLEEVKGAGTDESYHFTLDPTHNEFGYNENISLYKNNEHQHLKNLVTTSASNFFFCSIFLVASEV